MFKTELVSDKKIGRLRVLQTRVRLQENGHWMEPLDVQQYVDALIEGANEKFGFRNGIPKYKMLVRGLTPQGWWTLKTYQQENIDLQDIDDYLDGRVATTNKFGKFAQLQIEIAA